MNQGAQILANSLTGSAGTIVINAGGGAPTVEVAQQVSFTVIFPITFVSNVLRQVSSDCSDGFFCASSASTAACCASASARWP